MEITEKKLESVIRDSFKLGVLTAGLAKLVQDDKKAFREVLELAENECVKQMLLMANDEKTVEVSQSDFEEYQRLKEQQAKINQIKVENSIH